VGPHESEHLARVDVDVDGTDASPAGVVPDGGADHDARRSIGRARGRDRLGGDQRGHLPTSSRVRTWAATTVGLKGLRMTPAAPARTARCAPASSSWSQMANQPTRGPAPSAIQARESPPRSTSTRATSVGGGRAGGPQPGHLIPLATELVLEDAADHRLALENQQLAHPHFPPLPAAPVSLTAEPSGVTSPLAGPSSHGS